MSIKKQMAEVRENLADIIANTQQVKGDEFARLVGAAFESFQLVSLIDSFSNIVTANIEDEKQKEFVESMRTSSLMLVSSLLDKVSAGLPDSDQFKEAMEMGLSIFKRVVDNTQSIVEEKRRGQ